MNNLSLTSWLAFDHLHRRPLDQASSPKTGLRLAWIMGLLWTAVGASAQGILEPSANSSPAPGKLGPSSVAPASIQDLLHWGPIRGHLSLNYRWSYGDGIQSRPGQTSKSAINEFTPGLAFDIGNHWRLTYSSTLLGYSSASFQNSVGQSVSLSGGTTYQDWSLGLSQGYSSSSQLLVETGTQTEVESFSTGLSAAYQINQKTSLQMGVSQAIQSAQKFTSSSQWSTMEWLDYQFAPRFSGALGLGGGYVNVSAGADNAFEQLQARMNWKLGEKLTVSLNGGVEYRQFLGSDAAALVSPLYGLSVSYLLAETTTLGMGVQHAVTTSLFQSQVIESTSVTATVRQRLFKKLSLEVSGGFGTSSFGATTSGLLVNREDNLTQFSARLSAPFLKRGTAGIFYRSNENGANQSGFSLSTTQVGVELGYSF